jgi:hypothetical protein
VFCADQVPSVGKHADVSVVGSSKAVKRRQQEAKAGEGTPRPYPNPAVLAAIRHHFTVRSPRPYRWLSNVKLSPLFHRKAAIPHQ